MLRVKVSKNIVSVQETEPLVAGSVSVYECAFNFDDAWAGLDKSAVFRVGKRSVSVHLDDENRCKLPWEVLEKKFIGQPVLVGVCGTGAGEEFLSTVEDVIGVVRKGTEPGDNTKDPTPSLYQQFVTYVEEYADEAKIAAEAAVNAQVRTPYIDKTTGTWMVWSQMNGKYMDTGIHAEGKQGPRGEQGKQGNGIVSITCVGAEMAADQDGRVTKRRATYRVLYDDGRTFDFTVDGGADGKKGDKGTAGFSPIVYTDDRVDDDGRTIHEIMFRTASGMVTTEVRDGLDGQKGDHGATFTPSVDDDGNLSWTNDKKLPNPKTVNIKGPAPQKGKDYFTATDKQEIVAAVLANFIDASEVGM